MLQTAVDLDTVVRDNILLLIDPDRLVLAVPGLVSLGLASVGTVV